MAVGGHFQSVERSGTTGAGCGDLIVGDQLEILSQKYQDAIRTALKVQIPVAVLSMLNMDQGRTATVCVAVLAGFWLSAALIAYRRPWSPTENDLRFCRWGFIPALVLSLFAATWLGRM
jgi:hypothetical protein